MTTHPFYSAVEKRLEEGRLDEAVALCEKLLHNHADDAQLHFLEATAYEQLEQFDMAMRSLKKALKYNKKSAEIYSHLAQCYFRRNQLFLAERQCNKALRLNSNHHASLLLKARIHEKKRHYNKAIRYYRNAIAAYPQDPEIHKSLGLLLKHTKQYRPAIAHFRKAVYELPYDTISLKHLGECLYHIDHVHEAIITYRNLLMIQPHNPKICFELGHMLEQLEAYDQAMQYYIEAINLNPHDADSYNRLIGLFVKTNQLQKAEITLKKAYEALGSDDPLMLATGRLLEASGDLETAESLYQETLSRTDDLEQKQKIRFLLADLNERRGYYDIAYDFYLAAKKNFAASPLTQQCDAQGLHIIIERYQAWINQDATQGWSGWKLDDQLNTPIFIARLPGANFEPLEREINRHPTVTTTYNMPLIEDISMHLSQILERPFRMPQDITNLTKDEIITLRSHYSERLRGFLQEKVDTDLIVDTSIYNIIHLPLINRIFPEAKVVVLHRDPRDACINCLTKPFKATPISVHFTTLMQTAEFYCKILSLYLQYQRHLSIERIDIHIEDLYQNPKALTAFMQGVTSEQKPQYTPQLPPLNQGRYRHYGFQISEVLLGLEEYVGRF